MLRVLVMIDLTAAQFAFVYIGQVFSLSICLLMMGKMHKSEYIWLLSNAAAIVGVIIVSGAENSLTDFETALAAAVMLIGGALKAIAMAEHIDLRRRNIVPIGLAIISVVAAVLLPVMANSDFKLFLIVASAMTATAAMLIFLMQNRTFRATRGGIAMIYLLALNLLLLVIRVTSTYPIGSATRFLGKDDANFNNVAWTLLISLLLQIAFMGIVIGRRRRMDFLILRRKIRLSAIAESLAVERKEVAKLAAERFSLLQMLTHEVRQPLNNAQAALQSMLDELSRQAVSYPALDSTLRRTQKTMGAIALSVSNSIVGASLIHRNRDSNLEMTDICAVAHLALFDITPEDRVVINVHFDQEVIYANADPIILRLAIRNLLENAVKYSPAGSPIHFAVTIDEAQLCTVIQVRNTLVDSAMLEGDIFNRNTRGADSSYDGSGLGLYIVKEVAKIHHGTLNYEIDNGSHVTFRLAIPS